MAETTTTPDLMPVIKGKFQLALTNAHFQKIADKASSLTFNEDNVEEIKTFLDNVRKVKKAIDETHKSGKEEALKIGRQWDQGKRDTLAIIEEIESPVQKKYTEICTEIQAKIEKANAERQRISTIKNGIENNAIEFARKITTCNTAKELSDVEREINLEKTRSTKYQEFLPDAVERFSKLNAFVANQKKVIAENERIAKEQEEARKAGDDAKVIELEEKKDALADQIEENKILVQEEAISQATNSAPIEVEEVLPTVSARRTVWDFELVDEKMAMKKAPELLIVSLDKEKVKTGMKAMKDAGVFNGKKEVIINGIRYWEKVTF